MIKFFQKLKATMNAPYQDTAAKMYIAHRGKGDQVYSDPGCNYCMYVAWMHESTDPDYRDAGAAGMAYEPRPDIQPGLIREMK